jgi:hypothetical protein
MSGAFFSTRRSPLPATLHHPRALSPREAETDTHVSLPEVRRSDLKHLSSPHFWETTGSILIGAQYSIGFRVPVRSRTAVIPKPSLWAVCWGGSNQRWSDAEIPFERLADTFFTLPATPLRGHEFNTIFGDKFTLINAEFRFPLFAAILPGPVPILPLWNITGVAFLDAGAAWGFEVPYSRFTDRQDGNPIVYFENPAEL